MLLAGCASDDKGPAIDETAGNVAPATELGKLFEVKKAALVAASDPATSWPSVEDCDALLWAGMAKAAGVSLQLTVAEDLPGHWQRRPTPCWTPSDGDVGSRSTISQDNRLGDRDRFGGRGQPLRHQAGLPEQFHKRQGAAVQLSFPPSRRALPAQADRILQQLPEPLAELGRLPVGLANQAKVTA